MRDQVFGPEKVQLLDRCASVERAGLNWVVHSDSPVSPLGPLHMVRVAVARDLWKEPGTILVPDERVSVEAAIRAQTINAAWAQHEEDELGSLEPGKLADFVVLSDDPTAVDPEGLDQLRVRVTIKEDGVVFDAEGDEDAAGHRGDIPAGAPLAPGFELLEALEGASPTKGE